jgi:hypothetical protein
MTRTPFRPFQRPRGILVTAAAVLTLAASPALPQDVAVPRPAPSSGGGAPAGGGTTGGSGGGGGSWGTPSAGDGGTVRGGGRNPRSGDGGGGSRTRSGGGDSGSAGATGTTPRRSPGVVAPGDGAYDSSDAAGRRPGNAAVYAVPRGSVPPPPPPPSANRPPGYWGGGYGGWGWGAWSPWWGYGALLPGFIYYDPFWWGAYGGYPYSGYPYSGYPYGGSPYGYGVGWGSGGGSGGAYDPGSWSASQGVPSPEDGDGALRLRMKPGDAEVFVDGQPVGRVEKFNSSWQKLKLPAGRHTLEIKKDGFETLRLEVIVQPGQTLDVGQDLRRNP